ncbi:MAG TPA: hypothetical protein DFS52_00335 [Myxococcales bacterium]|jgi:hypothetical protein|nr:hypothetical protein [Myxococcales bacterium]
MNIEAAIVFMVILLGVGFVLLVLPLAVVLAGLPKLWKEQKGVAVFLLALVGLTAFFFAIFIAGLTQITFGAAS